MLLHNYMHRNLLNQGVGIEVEAEFLDQPFVPGFPLLWQSKGDGSLRYQGFEFVTRGVIAPEKIDATVKSLTDYLAKPEHKLILNSPRTSVHVHLNVGHQTVLNVYNILIGYWLLENLLTKFCGEELREGAHYCMRLCDSESVIDNILRDLADPEPLKSGILENRYMGQNMCSLLEHCSIEYRSLRGVYQPEIISNWAHALIALSEHSVTHGTPDNLMDWYVEELQDGNHDEILAKAFAGRGWFIDSLKTIPGYKSLMEETITLVDTIAYAHDWEKWHQRILERYGYGPESGPDPNPLFMPHHPDDIYYDEGDNFN